MSDHEQEIEFSETDSYLTDFNSEDDYSSEEEDPIEADFNSEAEDTIINDEPIINYDEPIINYDEPITNQEVEPITNQEVEPITNQEEYPIMNDVDFNIDLSQYQQNHNQFMKMNKEDIEFTLKALPFTFHPDSKSLFYKNNGSKVILPKYILYQLSEYENVCFPVTLKIGNNYLGVLEFAEFIDQIYIPNHLFYKLDIEENSLLSFNVLHKELPKATYLKFKPLDERFYTIENVKKYFEIHLKKLFNVLSQDQFISIPFADTLLPFIVTECKPEKNVSIDEIEELELDIDAMCEPKVMSAEKVEEEPIVPLPLPIPDPNPEFKPFSGKARSLKD